MSVSVESSIVVGVKASELLTLQVKENTYEVHDRKGNPTGTFDKEYIKFLRLKGNPENKYDYDGYFEDIWDILNVNDYPNEGDFGLHIIDYESEDKLENTIVGISLKRTGDLMYKGNSAHEISLHKILDVKKDVQTQIYYQYGVNIDPKIYLISPVSY